jgi:hypothetical protein
MDDFSLEFFNLADRSLGIEDETGLGGTGPLACPDFGIAGRGETGL